MSALDKLHSPDSRRLIWMVGASDPKLLKGVLNPNFRPFNFELKTVFLR